MTLARLCGSCGSVAPSQGPCPRCEPLRRVRENRRRRARPKHKLWTSRRWRKLRPRILRRDGYRCRICRRRRDELAENECLVVDHVDQEAYADPFNPDGLQTLCSRCSGRKDGPRARATPGMACGEN